MEGNAFIFIEPVSQPESLSYPERAKRIFYVDRRKKSRLLVLTFAEQKATKALRICV